MKVLLDTNIIIMAAKGEVTEEVERIICNSENYLYYSIAAYWEMVIKYKWGKLALPIEPRQIIDALKKSDYHALDIRESHVDKLANLPGIHKDPFDRIMLSQAISEKMMLLTTDSKLSDYGQNTLVVHG